MTAGLCLRRSSPPGRISIRCAEPGPLSAQHLPAAPFRADGVPKVGNGGGTEGIGDHMARVLERAARVSYAFVVMNYAAVAGLISFLRRDSIWRP